MVDDLADAFFRTNWKIFKNKDFKESEKRMGIIEEMLKEALYDGVVSCPACGTDVEPDYDICPECEKPNPLRKMGMI